MAGKKVCIICGKEKAGILVREDHVIRAVRWIKKNITKNEKNNVLVVCRTCYPKYREQRKKFTTKRAVYVALGTLFFIFGNILALSVVTFLITLGVLLFFYLLALFSYMPALDIKKTEKT